MLVLRPVSVLYYSCTAPSRNVHPITLQTEQYCNTVCNHAMHIKFTYCANLPIDFLLFCFRPKIEYLPQILNKGATLQAFRAINFNHKGLHLPWWLSNLHSHTLGSKWTIDIITGAKQYVELGSIQCCSYLRRYLYYINWWHWDCFYYDYLNICSPCHDFCVLYVWQTKYMANYIGHTLYKNSCYLGIKSRQ